MSLRRAHAASRCVAMARALGISRASGCAQPSTGDPRKPRLMTSDMPLVLTAALALREHPFASLPESITHEVLGVRYVHVRTEEGDLYLTERGWPWLTELLPENWWCDGQYKKSGTRLRFSTGAVYRVPIAQPRRIDIVVKFSRIGQYLDAGHLGGVHAQNAGDDPSFLSPFEEIAALDQLRNAPRFSHMITKRALGVFSPRERYKDWQLGRIQHHFERHARRVVEGQTKDDLQRGFELDPNRSYITVFHWMKGLNLEECVEQGLLDWPSVESINRRVLDDLGQRGFKVLDHKPNHVIVSFTRRGALLKRHGRVVYGLADFELLQKRDIDDQWHAGSSQRKEPSPLGHQEPSDVKEENELTAT